MRNRLVLLPLMASMAAFAQESSSITISTNPSGVRFAVDGREYIRPASFSWPKGSKHVVTILGPRPTEQPINEENLTGFCREATLNVDPRVQYDPTCRTRYSFSSWRENTGKLSGASDLALTITADPSLTSLVAEFNVEHRLNITFFSEPGASGATSNTECSSGPLGPRPPGAGPGVVFVGGTCYRYSASVFLPPGDLTLHAVPYDGFVFLGWTFDYGPGQPQFGTYRHGGPGTIVPRFEQGKRVRFYTEPRGLDLMIDRTRIDTIDPASEIPVFPRIGQFDWANNSKHTLSAVSPQNDNHGRAWVFDSWNFGGGQDFVYTVTDVLSTETFTAKFVPGANMSFHTEPAGLKLEIDGSQNLPNYTFTWGLGHKHKFSAPAEQTDARGRKYVFKSWSNGGDARQEITVTQAMVDQGLRTTAVFERLPQAIIRSSVPGVKLKVDGVECTTPCTIDRPSGTAVRISAPTTLSNSEVTRLQFIGWSDGGGADRSLTLTGDQTTIQAVYKTYNRLSVVVDPAEGARIHVDPASEDGFYPADSAVTLTAEVAEGYKFRRWDGDLGGTDATGTVAMGTPAVVRALLEKVPFIPPAGVKNAAGDTPQSGVAAGSVISIFGSSLARVYEAGPASPMAQTLVGTAVTVGDRLLPLVFVSPDQINAVLPADLPLGEHTLLVKAQGQQDVTGKFTVIRNGPGLFSNRVDDRFYALALHEDGSSINQQSPARRNETITILGTGFGPFSRPVFEGFAAPASPQNTLADPAVLVAGSSVIQPVFTGLAPGYVGITSMRVRITPEFPLASTIEIRVNVNGADSNTVLLPVE